MAGLVPLRVDGVDENSRRVGPGPSQLKGGVMSNRLFIGLLAAGVALSLSEACNHGATNGSTGTAGAGSSTGTGNGSGQAGSGSGSAGTSGSAGSNGDTGAAGSSTSGTGN